MPGLLQPAREVVKRVSTRDVVDQQGPRRPPVVRPRDRAERFLPRLRLSKTSVNRCQVLGVSRPVEIRVKDVGQPMSSFGFFKASRTKYCKNRGISGIGVCLA